MFADQALKKIIENPDIKTILDIGAGNCMHSNRFAGAGKKVTALDHRLDPGADCRITYIRGMFENFPHYEFYDCIWAAHVIEHTLDPHSFLLKMVKLCKEGGTIAITFPPMKQQIVGGHINLFNPGIILYRMVLAGLDCSKAQIKEYGYNISIIVQKVSHNSSFWTDLKFDSGDIEVLSDYLPVGYNTQGFNGDIKEHNW